MGHPIVDVARHGMHSLRTDREQELLDHRGVGDEAVVGAEGDAQPVGQHILRA